MLSGEFHFSFSSFEPYPDMHIAQISSHIEGSKAISYTHHTILALETHKLLLLFSSFDHPFLHGIIAKDLSNHKTRNPMTTCPHPINNFPFLTQFQVLCTINLLSNLNFFFVQTKLVLITRNLLISNFHCRRSRCCLA